MDYSIYDAIKAGFGKIVFVIRKDFEQDFRDKILSKYEGHIPAEVCFQSLDALPEGSTNQYAMVGFRVGNTLSENGTVARGICSKDEQDNLTTVVERTEIVRCAEDGSQQGDDAQPIRFKDEEGKWVVVDDNTPVSMNMWGFTPDYFEHSEAFFKQFLSDPKNMSNLKAEFFIPLMVNKLIVEKTASVKVLDTTSKWFGVTYAADRQATVDKIRQLIQEGVYPQQLF